MVFVWHSLHHCLCASRHMQASDGVATLKQLRILSWGMVIRDSVCPYMYMCVHKINRSYSRPNMYVGF